MKRLIGLVLVAIMLVACVGVGVAQQYGGSQSSGVSIPSPPPKPVPDRQYGNNDRAAIIGERMSDASQGNAKVYINEGDVITADVYLKQNAQPSQIAATMANFTYMLADLYSLTDKANSDIVLKVYDTAKNVIIDAKFSTAKNAFDYLNIPESTAASSSTP